MESMLAGAHAEDWAAVDAAVVESTIADHYHAPRWMILGAALGQQFRTPWAFYRVAPDAPPPPEDWSWRMHYAGIIAGAIIDARSTRRKGYTAAARSAWAVVDMLAAYGASIAPDKAIKAATAAGLDALAAELRDVKGAMETLERDARSAEIGREIDALRERYGSS